MKSIRQTAPAAILFVLLAGAFVMIPGAVPSPASGPSGDARSLTRDLQALVQNQVDPGGDDPIHSAILLVEGPGIEWKGAAGMADGRSERMTPEHKFKIASIAKLFTATVVLQLMEQGRLGLDDRLEKYLDDADVDLDRLHLRGGISRGRQITIEQLLGHTSGLGDYMEDPRFIPDVLEHPDVQWSPAKILGRYFAYGTNERALFPPGEGWNYADPNYVLLGMLIEKVTGSTLQSELRARIFDRLHMENSYLEFYEKARGPNPLSHAFFGALDLNLEVNTSFDWGGGGVVSTCDDLNAFIRALLGGRLFEKKSTLTRMLAAADRGYGGEEYDYGLGIMKRSIAGLTFYGHGGAYDCDLFYSPEADISLCMSLNQMNTHGRRDEFVRRAVELLVGS